METQLQGLRRDGERDWGLYLSATVWLLYLQREIRETGHEHMGPVEDVRCVVTGHTPVPEPT